jgi:hypothetical protein
MRGVVRICVAVVRICVAVAEITERKSGESRLSRPNALSQSGLAGRIATSERNARAREGVHMCGVDIDFTPNRNESRS